ncbi:sugar ABC transporter substrate-binding protein [Agromyces sp. NPDC058126]|uniref:sugar ABC transporter substrate-binding protein n=1 Tax=Agromyces sp. NPDC058126 TaxID=3346350 RepID=UPI0036DB11CA
MKRLKIAAVTSAFAVLALSGCSTGGSATSEGDAAKGAVAMSFAGLDIQVWNDMLPFMEDTVEGAGYEFVTDDPKWNAQTQVSDWESWIVRGDIKAIMGYPVQSDAMVAVTQRASEMGIPVLGYGSTWDGVAAAVYFDHLADGKKLGEKAAEWIAERYGSEHVEVALLGYPDTDLGRLRGEGIKEALDEAGLDLNVNEHSVLNLDDGYSAVQNQLNAFPDTKVWLAVSNDPAQGAYQALIDSGVSPTDDGVLLANLDGTDAELDAVAGEGSLWRFIYLAPAREIGEANAELLISAAEGETVEDQILPLTFVDAANAEDYLLANQ